MAGEREAETRKNHIDKALLTAGWNEIVPFHEKMFIGTAAVEEYPTLSGPADYVLFHDGLSYESVHA